jgi:hypothetical protein
MTLGHWRMKHDERGKVVKHKDRLVAKGYLQKQGIDFEEVFAPVARLELVRVLLILAGHHNWAVHHMDVESPLMSHRWEVNR